MPALTHQRSLTIHWFWSEHSKKMQFLIINPASSQAVTFNDNCWEGANGPELRPVLSCLHDLAPAGNGRTTLVINMSGGSRGALQYRGQVNEYGRLESVPDRTWLGLVPSERRAVLFGTTPLRDSSWALPISIHEPTRTARLYSFVLLNGVLQVAHTKYGRSPFEPMMPWDGVTHLLDLTTGDIMPVQAKEPALW